MITQAAASGDMLAQVNEVLNLDEPSEIDDEHDEGVDDNDIDINNSGEADSHDDESHDDDEGESGDDDEDSDEDDDSGEDEGEDEDGDIESISQLAKHLDAEEGQIYSLEVPMGDGLEPVSISALKDSYMSRERDQKQFADDKANFESVVREQQSQWAANQNLPELNNQVLSAATTVRAIEQADENFDWEALEQSDPTQAILQRQKLNDALQMARDEHAKAVDGVKGQQAQAFMNMKAFERMKTLEVIPEWSDPSAYQKDADRMGPLLAEYGFSADEVQNVYDHRLTKVIRDFMLLKDKANGGELLKKKLRVNKKKLTSKNSQSVKVGKSVALKKKINLAANSKDDRVKANAVSDLLNNI